MKARLWHNPRCSKSRETLAILQGSGAEIEERRYLENPPSEDELRAALEALGVPARALIRKGEAVYKALGLGDPGLSEDALVAAMAAHPILIERPVVFTEKGARLGRPPEAVREIL